MAIRFRKSALKFLQKADAKDAEKIQATLRQLLAAVETQGVIPFTDLDIKQMQGDWQGFYRLRIGKIRVLFTVEVSSGEIEIYSIGSRGDVYKSR